MEANEVGAGPPEPPPVLAPVISITLRYEEGLKKHDFQTTAVDAFKFPTFVSNKSAVLLCSFVLTVPNMYISLHLSVEVQNRSNAG